MGKDSVLILRGCGGSLSCAELLEDAWRRDTRGVLTAVERGASRAGFLLEPVRMPGHMPGQGEWEDEEGPVVGGTRQTLQREPCLVWGHAGAQEATLAGQGEPGKSSCPPGRLVLFWDSQGRRAHGQNRGSGALLSSLLSLPTPTRHCMCCHCPLPGLESLETQLHGGRRSGSGRRPVQVRRAPPGDTLAPQPCPHPQELCDLPAHVLAAALPREEGESGLAWPWRAAFHELWHCYLGL